MKTRLVLGDHNAICDGCGRKFKASQLQKTWEGYYMCKDDWEPRNEQDFVRGVEDDPSVPWSRPEPTDAGGTDINGNTVPPTFVDIGETVPTGTNNGDL